MGGIWSWLYGVAVDDRDGDEGDILMVVWVGYGHGDMVFAVDDRDGVDGDILMVVWVGYGRGDMVLL